MIRSGLSLIELIVVFAILAVLAAVLLPAVQSARESARRTQCSSNLRQIAVALHAYEGQFGSFPYGNSRSYSFVTQILPHVEQQPLYDAIQSHAGYWDELPSELLRRVRVTAYLCPSDGTSQQRESTTNYAGNLGYDVLTKGANGVFHPFTPAFEDPWRGTSVHAAQITDGLSQTALVGEWLVSERSTINFGMRLRRNWMTGESFAPGQHDQFVKACLNQEFATAASGHPIGFGTRGLPLLEGSAGTTLYTHCITPNNLSCQNGSSVPFGAYTLASNHPGGVMVAYADGHLGFHAQTVDLTVWRALGTRAGGEASQ